MNRWKRRLSAATVACAVWMGASQTAHAQGAIATDAYTCAYLAHATAQSIGSGIWDYGDEYAYLGAVYAYNGYIGAGNINWNYAAYYMQLAAMHYGSLSNAYTHQDSNIGDGVAAGTDAIATYARVSAYLCLAAANGGVTETVTNWSVLFSFTAASQADVASEYNGQYGWAGWAVAANNAGSIYDYGAEWEEDNDWLYYAYYYASETLNDPDDGVWAKLAEVEPLPPSSTKTYYRGRLMQWAAHTWVAMILNYHAFQYTYFNP